MLPETLLSRLTTDELDCLLSSIKSASDAQQLETLEQLMGTLPSTGTDTTATAKTATASTDYATPLDPSVFCGYPLSAKQLSFANNFEYEGMFGGALGGGKSDALLQAGSQFVHVPSYHAIIFRRTRPNCQDLIDRSQRWFSGLARWNGSVRGGRWIFPSSAILEFGYMQHANDVFNYKGPEYQFVGFDELTEFLKSQYEYMHTRLRKKTCVAHYRTGFVQQCPVCQVSKYLQGIPLRIRSGTNPDGPGREWVKNMFISEEAASDADRRTLKPIYHKGDRFFVPSLVHENPGVNVEEYTTKQLSRLSPAKRLQLRYGSWTSVEGAILKQEWLRYWTHHGEFIVVHDSKHQPTPIHIDQRTCRRFATCDTASTGTAEAKRRSSGKQPSWSVCLIWDWVGVKAGGYLVLRHVWRDQVEWIDLKKTVPQVLRQWNCREVIIEKANSGVQLIEELKDIGGFQVKAFIPGSKRFRNDGSPGKVDRSRPFQNLLEAGKVLLPLHENSGWRTALEDEWITWTGDEDEPADQVDAASIAAIECESMGAGSYPVPGQSGVRDAMRASLAGSPLSKRW